MKKERGPEQHREQVGQGGGGGQPGPCWLLQAALYWQSWCWQGERPGQSLAGQLGTLPCCSLCRLLGRVLLSMWWAAVVGLAVSSVAAVDCRWR